MRILITTGLSVKEVGGPAQYGENLQKAFQEEGHGVKLVSYSKVERALPIGLRHLYFFIRILPASLWANNMLTLDTFSVGLPTVVASKIFRRKVIVRVGGDFLWSAYVNRTGAAITLPDFYKKLPELNTKEKIIFSLTKFLTRYADFLAFNTEWQKGIWESYYDIKSAGVVRNFIPSKKDYQIPKIKNFLWAGRKVPIKNLLILEEISRSLGRKHQDFKLDIITGEARENILERIRAAYAVILPSVSDVCPNFIIEAASYNKPFIVTKETGLSEIYPTGGFFVDPFDEGGIESAIEAMLDFRVYNDLVESLKTNNLNRSWQDLALEFTAIWKID